MNAPEAYWLLTDENLTLIVNGQKRAEANPILNYGEIFDRPNSSDSRKSEHLVLPLERSIIDEIEKRFTLTKLPFLDKHGRQHADKRREIAAQNVHFREQRYLDTGNPRKDVAEALTKAYAALNEASRDRSLTPGAIEARAKCAEALRILEDRTTPEGPTIPAEVAKAVKSASQSLHKDDPEQGKSFVEAQSAHVYEARFYCDRAREHVEKQEKDLTRKNNLIDRLRSSPRQGKSCDNDGRER